MYCEAKPSFPKQTLLTVFSMLDVAALSAIQLRLVPESAIPYAGMARCPRFPEGITWMLATPTPRPPGLSGVATGSGETANVVKLCQLRFYFLTFSTTDPLADSVLLVIMSQG